MDKSNRGNGYTARFRRRDGHFAEGAVHILGWQWNLHYKTTRAANTDILVYVNNVECSDRSGAECFRHNAVQTARVLPLATWRARYRRRGIDFLTPIAPPHPPRPSSGPPFPRVHRSHVPYATINPLAALPRVRTHAHQRFDIISLIGLSTFYFCGRRFFFIFVALSVRRGSFFHLLHMSNLRRSIAALNVGLPIAIVRLRQLHTKG